MNKSTSKAVSQVNKNNKTKPENLMKKEYLQSYEELRKSIIENQKIWKKEGDIEKMKTIKGQKSSLF